MVPGPKNQECSKMVKKIWKNHQKFVKIHTFIKIWKNIFWAFLDSFSAILAHFGSNNKKIVKKIWKNHQKFLKIYNFIKNLKNNFWDLFGPTFSHFGELSLPYSILSNCNIVVLQGQRCLLFLHILYQSGVGVARLKLSTVRWARYYYKQLLVQLYF